MDDFLCHHDGIRIEEFMDLLKSFIEKYVSDKNESNVRGVKVVDRKVIQDFCKGGNLEFCFSYKTFTIKISVLKLQNKDYHPYITISVLDISAKERFGFSQEKNALNHLLLDSIHHQLHTPITYVLASMEIIYSQLEKKYSELFYSEQCEEHEIIKELEIFGIKKDYYDIIMFLKKA